MKVKLSTLSQVQNGKWGMEAMKEASPRASICIPESTIRNLLNAQAVLAEEAVNVFVSNLREGSLRAAVKAALLLLNLAHQFVKDLAQFRRSAFDAQSHQPEAGPLIEDHDQDHATIDHRDMQIIPLTLVRQHGELFLTNQPRQTVSRSNITGGQRSEAGCIKTGDITIGCDLLPVLVDEEDHLRIRVSPEPGDDRLDPLILFLIHDHCGFWH